MATYEKWLGAGIGWMTGGPIGGLIGYAAGKSAESRDQHTTKNKHTGHTSDFEANLLVMAAAVVKADGNVSLEEINFVRSFFNEHFPTEHLDEKMAIFQHCLQKGYSPRKACDDVRLSSTLSTREQVVNFLFDLATCDRALAQTESDLIFVLAGWLNVNDIEFKKIKTPYTGTRTPQPYILLGIHADVSYEEIKGAYRKLVLEYHPDRNTGLSPAKQATIAEKFRKIQAAFETIKAERGFE